AVAGFAAGTPEVAEALGLPYAPEALDLGLLAALVAGSCVGFLWFNLHPAQVFMGDTGSLALGTGLGLLAAAMRLEFLLAIAGAVFVAEALSVMLQVGFFKLSKGKRIFRCAPLHHHFQFGGWAETRVTGRFWLVSALACCLALASLASNAPA